MWNDGNNILWYHFVKIVHHDAQNPLKIMPKLTLSHINLTPYSKMNVRLAVQTLSDTTARILKSEFPIGTFETSELCSKVNKFFDCLNARSQKECTLQLNENCAPYRVVNDARLKWLKDDFLQYLLKWKKSIENRPGNFTETQKDKMFLSHQTYKGIIITVNSTIEIVKYLVKYGEMFVLTERFNQDLLEEYFGKQRSLGRRNDNPSTQQFKYQANAIDMSMSVKRKEGSNTYSRCKKSKRSWSAVDHQPLEKRKPGHGLY